ncbi:o-succinylbenzoate--CoA ligase [Pasteurella sp. PK-2025]|uniref:o-succinylbenzoate--CoA ligase n=1 Tax=unclassified Pasteurella TaxID=2621516 RepID=UPI003C74D472
MFPWQQFSSDPHFMHHIALQDSQGEVFTWAALNQKIDQVARLLHTQGLQAQQGIALCGKNDLSLLLVYFAALQLGARVLPLNPAFPQEKIIQLCEEMAIHFYYSATHPLTHSTIQSLSFDLVMAAIHHEQEMLPECPPESRKVRSIFKKFYQPATMTLTSGSNGKPKAVVHHIQAHLDNAKGVCQLMQFTPQHSWLLSLPMYHVSGQGILWRWLLVGARLHLPRQDFYASVCQATHVSLVPTQLQRLLQYWQDNPTCAYQTTHILLGGAAIPTELTQRLAEKGVASYSGYGMTEMGSTVFAKCSDGRAGVGQPLLGREYQLVDEEIWLRGAGLAMGYWQQGQLLPLTNAQGWLQTKDRGQWRERELVILGRLDNMFISGGENIQPEEIEAVISGYPAVKQVFVLPKEDSAFGQRPVAMIAFYQPFSARLVEDLQLWLTNKLEKFKQPVQYFSLDVEKLTQGAIKISRTTLKTELKDLLGK